MIEALKSIFENQPKFKTTQDGRWNQYTQDIFQATGKIGSLDVPVTDDPTGTSIQQRYYLTPSGEVSRDFYLHLTFAKRRVQITLWKDQTVGKNGVLESSQPVEPSEHQQPMYKITYETF